MIIIISNIYIPLWANILFMISKSLLRTIIADQSGEIRNIKEYVPRSIFPDAMSYNGTSAFVIKGVRRCGKSTLLMQLIKTKFEDNALYFNFDDERVMGIRSGDLQALIETLVEEFGDKRSVFFDEIQNVVGWELFVNRLLRQGYKVFITGSNANLLSKELGTHMTGRHTDMEMYPFSFTEFVKARSPDYSKRGAYSTSQKAMLSRLFKEYMVEGGMPEAVVFSNKAMLISVVNDIVARDILARHSIRRTEELKSVIRFLIANASNMITYRSITENFGIRSPNTVQKYIEYASETYLIFEVRKFEKKLSKFDKNPKKIYCIDNGIMVKNTPTLIEKKGAILENIAAVQLKRLGNEFYYYKNNAGWEADFIIPSKGEAIQVCYELNEGNREREIRGLSAAMKETRAKKAIILTLEQEEEIRQKGITITVRPLWQWLLENEPG